MTEKRAEYQTTQGEEIDDYMLKLHEYWCTMGKAAEILGVNPRHVRRLAENGNIVTDELDNGQHLAFIPSLYEYNENRQKEKRGRPRGAKGKKNSPKTRAKNT